MRKLSSISMYMGCDPEFFFSKKGEVFGAEKVIPPDGIVYEPGTCKWEAGNPKRDGDYTSLQSVKSKIIIDGVQAELNPRPNTCRANLGNEISACFRKIYSDLKMKNSFDIDFSPVIEVSKKEMDSLSEKSKQFGCAPSKNIYNTPSKIKVNPAEYRYRSAGGHIHLSGNDTSSKSAISHPERLVPMLDIVLGNTCVLLDRNEMMKERRKIYGRAGEYRLPAHGLEYRTLSNFWLLSYPLMSFVMGLSKLSVSIIGQSETDYNYEEAILSVINKDNITEAINENNFELAEENFEKLEPVILDITTTDNPINSYNIKQFKYFVKKGIHYWFKDPSLEHWMKLPEGHGNGWESFLDRKVESDLIKEKQYVQR